MRLKNIPGAREKIKESEFLIPEGTETKGKWHSIFQNQNPIYIEIGMGKGTFILQSALNNPDINYVGIEKYSSVLLRAAERADRENIRLTSENKPQISNLRFLRMDAEQILNVFAENEVSRIYLNFSDPWPKNRQAKRRLTSSRFLPKYEILLQPDGCLRFKTDNDDLFAFSLYTAKEMGWHIAEQTDDLHHSPFNSDNIMTEYETKFSVAGKKIHYMKILPPQNGKIS